MKRIAILAAGLVVTSIAAAQPRSRAQGRLEGARREAERPPIVDRVVVRWTSRATGGVTKPQIITARQLAFEARIEALSEGEGDDEPYTDKHVRAAIQRNIAESMLAMLPVKPRPSPKQVARYAEAARLLIEQQVGGRARLNAAASAEGITADELNALLRRQARASWYLDKMVAPMLEPSELDLRDVHRRGETPFTKQPFEEVKQALERWYISTRLTNALEQYYRSARSRVNVTIIAR